MSIYQAWIPRVNRKKLNNLQKELYIFRRLCFGSFGGQANVGRILSTIRDPVRAGCPIQIRKELPVVAVPTLQLRSLWSDGFAELFGGHACGLAEGPHHIFRIAKAGSSGDLFERHIGGAQEFFDAFDLPIPDLLRDRAA